MYRTSSSPLSFLMLALLVGASWILPNASASTFLRHQQARNNYQDTRSQMTCRITASEIHPQHVNCSPIEDGVESLESYHLQLPERVSKANQESIQDGELVVVIDGAALVNGQIEVYDHAMWLTPLRHPPRRA